MSDLVVPAIWFLLAPGAANMAPVFAAKIWPSWKAPLDQGLVWRRERILGDHKTVRGLVAGSCASEAIFLLQRQVNQSEMFPDAGAPIYFGFWIGFWVLVADAVKSFLKRRRGIRPGAPWMPFDQIDWIFGAWLAALPFHHFEIAPIMAVFVIGFAFSLGAHFIGYLLRLNADRF